LLLGVVFCRFEYERKHLEGLSKWLFIQVNTLRQSLAEFFDRDGTRG
jgi:hypothetical protein